MSNSRISSLPSLVVHLPSTAACSNLLITFIYNFLNCCGLVVLTLSQYKKLISYNHKVPHVSVYTPAA